MTWRLLFYYSLVLFSFLLKLSSEKLVYTSFPFCHQALDAKKFIITQDFQIVAVLGFILCC